MTSRQVIALFWMLFLFLAQHALYYILPWTSFPLLFIGVTFFALTEGPVFGVMIGFFAGFLLDMLGSGKLGGALFMYSLWGMLAGFSSTKIFYDSYFTQTMLPTAGYFVNCAINIFFAKNISGEGRTDIGILRQAFLVSQPWFTVISSVAVFAFLKKFYVPRHS